MYNVFLLREEINITRHVCSSGGGTGGSSISAEARWRRECRGLHGYGLREPSMHRNPLSAYPAHLAYVKHTNPPSIRPYVFTRFVRLIYIYIRGTCFGSEKSSIMYNIFIHDIIIYRRLCDAGA